MQCQLCQRVARALSHVSGYRVPKYYNTEGNRFVKLGSWQEIQDNKYCSTCSLIAVFFNDELQKHGCDLTSANYEIWLWDFSKMCLALRSQSESNTFWPCFPIDPLSEGSSEYLGVVMNQDWVDFERIQEWIKSCDTMHGKCHCKNFSSGGAFPSQDTYLISVSRNCLVKAKSGDRYVALSYVWGAELRQFRTLRANLTFLQSKGSFSDTTIQDDLPDTIKRAMHFTLLLDLEFLWVDLLCIVQDDPIHTAAQINHMASIFSNSYLTLCAADGTDANSGLLGVPQCSRPRNVQQGILTFADGSVTSRWVRRMHEASVYDERGWTFQEKVLSQRMLSFTNHGLEWRCQEVVSQEQYLGTRRPDSTYSDLGVVRADTLWPCLKKWDNLVTSYLKRRLTYEEDILWAISGTLGALDSSMLEGFHFGLPQQFFDAALLWVPSEHMTRRENLRNGSKISASPSWSWAGWKGATESQINGFGLRHERSNFIMDHKPRRRDIFPCVTWFKIDIDTLEKARIPNDYAKYQADGLEGTVTLPLGWSSYLDEDDRPFYYRYDRAPASSTFWYPIPTVRNTQQANERQWGPVLYFKTLRGFLEMGNALSQEEQGGSTYPLHILETKEGEWAGVIYVHRLPEAARAQCELVLMSVGFAFENGEDQVAWIPEWNYARRPRFGYYYLFYHVLWIEWQGGIAYRKGLGRVVKRVWDDLSKDEAEIFLG